MANQPARREGVVAGDTIVASATAAGQAAIAVVRISGPDARRIGTAIAGRELKAREALYCKFRAPDGERIDDGIALWFPEPGSETGEDVVELQCHGSPVVVDWLLQVAHVHGARPAGPGEFTLRAFLNDKLDLTQAEAIADLIASGSRAQARAAGQSLRGRFSERVDELQKKLTELRVLCESWLDFPDEDIDRDTIGQLEQRWRDLQAGVAAVERDAAHGLKLSDGLKVAIAGQPNAGKSSLLNQLAGADAAIVTEIPGTTRDTIRHDIDLDGIVLTLVDMAGLRETSDRIESEGIRRARREIAEADHVLWIADVEDGLEAAQREARRAIPAERPFTLVLNKIDVIYGLPRAFADTVPVFALSAKTGAGLEALRAHLRKLAGLDEIPAGAFSARRRHLDALARASARITAAGTHFAGGLEIAAEELKGAQAELDSLTGAHTSDDLLGEIFSSFCIGK